LKLLVTGGTGFIGTPLICELLRQNVNVIAYVRHHSTKLPSVVNQVIIDDLPSLANWTGSLAGVDAVIHLAARVHIMNDKSLDPLTEFRKINTVATLNLARQAAKSGIKRFILLSSIKVNGELTKNGIPFRSDVSFIPTDPYGRSKYEAEQGLLAISKETGMEVVIIRSPLVYGVGVKANFASMVKWVHRGIPLPFGAIHNQRSLVALDNLVSFIIHCIAHPKAANEVFLISDGEDVSTTELLQKVAKAFGKKSLLVPVPVSLMKFFAKLLGRADMVDRLFGSLQVDSSKANDLLCWQPIITMDKQLKKMVERF